MEEELRLNIRKETDTLKDSILEAISRFYKNTGLIVDSFKIINVELEITEITIKVP